MSTPTQDKTTASVTGYAHGGTCEISTHAGVPTPADLQARADAIGLPSIRPAVLDAGRKLSAVGHWLTLKRQIDAANKTVEAAKETERRVAAARTLLESRPEDDLAAALRKIEGEIVAATAAREQAERDLAQLEYLVPRHYAAAANAITSHADTTAFGHQSWLVDEQRAAAAELNEACRRVEAILLAAVEEHLAPVAARLLTLTRASDLAQVAPFAESVREQVVGAVPAGVRRHPTGRFEVAQPPAAEVKEAAQEPPPMNQPVVLENPSRRELLERRRI